MSCHNNQQTRFCRTTRLRQQSAVLDFHVAQGGSAHPPTPCQSSLQVHWLECQQKILLQERHTESEHIK